MITPALSSKTDTQGSSFPFSFLIFSVAPLMQVLKRLSMTSTSSFSLVYSIRALKILCLQCSDHVWAKASNSRSMIFPPRPNSLRARMTESRLRYA